MTVPVLCTLVALATKHTKLKDIYGFVSNPAVLKKACDMVFRARGSDTPGVDGVTKQQIKDQGVPDFLSQLGAKLKNRSYRPQPLQRAILRRRGKCRRLAVPTLEDRVVATTVRLVLEAIYDQSMMPNVYGHRVRRGSVKAIKHLHLFANTPYQPLIVQADIADWFPSITQGRLLSLLQQRISDHRFLELVRRLICAPVKTRSGKMIASKGLAQGSPLSAYLATIYLMAVHPMFRDHDHVVDIWYADDVALLVHGTHEQAVDVLRELEQRLLTLGLRLHPGKTRISNLFVDVVTYLGVDFQLIGGNIELSPARSTIERFKSTLCAGDDHRVDAFVRYYRRLVPLAAADACGWELRACVAQFSTAVLPPAPPQTSPPSAILQTSGSPGAQQGRPGQVAAAGGAEDPKSALFVEQFASCAGRTSSATGPLFQDISHKGTLGRVEDGELLTQRSRGPGQQSPGPWAASIFLSHPLAVRINGTNPNPKENHIMSTENPTQGNSALPKLPTRLMRKLQEVSRLLPSYTIEDLLSDDADDRIDPSRLRRVQNVELGRYSFVSTRVSLWKSRHVEASARRKRHEAETKMQLRERSYTGSQEEYLLIDPVYQKLQRSERDAHAVFDFLTVLRDICLKRVEACSRWISLRDQEIREEWMARK